MALNLTTADAALKEFYLPALRNQLNNDTPMLNIVEPKKVDIEGRRAILSLRVGRNSGHGARKDGGTLPTAGNQQYAEERVPLRYNYGRIEVSGPTIKAMKSDKGSFVRAVDSEVKGITEDLKRDINRQLWGTSNGVIATCGAAGPSTTITLAASTTAVQMRQFYVGMKVDVATVAQAAAGSGGKAHNATITAVSVSGKTITIDASVTTAGTDFVFVAGNGGATTDQRELTGLQTIVSNTGAVFNVDPATQPLWASTVVANSGTPRAVSEVLMAQTVHEIQIASGEWPTHIITSHSVHRAYANLLMGSKRYPGTTELKGGYSAVPFAAAGPELPVIFDRDAPDNEMHIINANHLNLGRGSDWEWMDEDGAVLSRVSGKDAYEATLFLYAEQFTDMRNAHGKLDDLTGA